MTTTVTVNAHCDPNATEVLVEFSDTPDSPVTLLDGESQDFYAYDDRVITVREVEKSSQAEPGNATETTDA